MVTLHAAGRHSLRRRGKGRWSDLPDRESLMKHRGGLQHRGVLGEDRAQKL